MNVCETSYINQNETRARFDLPTGFNPRMIYYKIFGISDLFYTLHNVVLLNAKNKTFREFRQIIRVFHF